MFWRVFRRCRWTKGRKYLKWPISSPTQRQLWPLFMSLTFTFLHLMNFLTSHPSHSLFRYFRCVYGGLKTAFAAVSKEASASQQTAPVLSLTCVLNSWPHSCRGSPSSSCINLARIQPQACSKDSVAQGQRSTLEDTLALGLSHITVDL